MNAPDLTQLLQDLADLHELDRRERLAELEGFDIDAANAEPVCSEDVYELASAIKELRGPEPEEALYLIHAIWTLCRKANNQHHGYWVAAIEELESVQRCLIDTIEEREREDD